MPARDRKRMRPPQTQVAGVGQASREETAGRAPVAGVARSAMGIGWLRLVGAWAAGPIWSGWVSSQEFGISAARWFWRCRLKIPLRRSTPWPSGGWDSRPLTHGYVMVF